MARPRERGFQDPYPSSDGLALHGTTWHEAAVRRCHNALDRHFGWRKDMLIASGLALYYEPAPKGQQGRSLIPDLMVVIGISAHGRRSYKVWEEGGRVPQFVLEVASAKTVDRECEFKKDEYERLGVREYWQLDQTGKLLPQPLQGHRLVLGRYQRVEPWAGESGREIEYQSMELGLLLRVRLYRGGWTIVFREVRTGKEIPVGRAMDRLLEESAERARQAKEQARQAKEQARQAEEQARQAEEQTRQAKEQTRQAKEQTRQAKEQTRQAKERLRQAQEKTNRTEQPLDAERRAMQAADERIAELTRRLNAYRESD